MVTENNKFRFNIQFTGDTEENIRIGNFLNGLKNKKSVVIVSALSEYLENHPEISTVGTINTVQINKTTAIDEETIKKMVENIIRNGISPQTLTNSVNPDKEAVITEEKIDTTVLSMLENLDMF